MIVRRVVYLLANTGPEGLAYAEAQQGWTRIASMRYATGDNLDIRIVTRPGEIVGPSNIPLLKTPQWGLDPEAGPFVEAIAKMIETGYAYWVEDTDDDETRNAHK